MNKYFEELTAISKLINCNYEDVESAKQAIKPTLLKLNNPTFYSKFVYSNPSEAYDYPGTDYTKNPFVQFTAKCIKILNNCQEVNELLQQLQIEYSWTMRKNIEHYSK